MQTFLPYSDFMRSALVLDKPRLGKQRVETLQLLKALHGQSKGWVNHPASVMWRGYENRLIDYGLMICHVWVDVHGYKDTCAEKIRDFYDSSKPDSDPPWMGDPLFHESHRSNLIRKDPWFYAEKFPDTEWFLDYVWPT